MERNVQLKYRLYRRRNGVFYWQENDSRKQGTLRTGDRREAERLLNAMNESHREPTLNLNLACAYLAAHDPKMAQRTWQAVMDEMATHGIPTTQERCARGFRSKAYDAIRNKPLVQTTGEDLLEIIHANGNCVAHYLRRLHNLALDLGWLPWPILAKRAWPKIRSQSKRAITAEEHAAVIASEKNPERRAYYELLYETGVAQTDAANLTVEVVTELSQAFALCAGTEEAIAIRDDTGFLQAVKAALAKKRGPHKTTEQLDHAVRQLVAKAIAPEGEIIDVFQAAGLKQPDISILSDQFLAEVRGLKYKNVAAELLAKLLGDEIKMRSKRNLVQSREFSAVTRVKERPGFQMLKKTLNAYHNRAIATQEVIEELIKLAKQLKEADQRGVELGLNDQEVAFYDALAANNSAVEVMGKDELKVIATELVTQVRKSVTIDWTLRESARAKIKVLVKRILRKHGYPPDLQDEATKLVLQQAELLCAEWAA